MPQAKWQYKYRTPGLEPSSHLNRPSVKAVWEFLKGKGSGDYTVRGIAEATGFSVGQVHRALKTLAALGVIRWNRAPKLGSHIAIAEENNSGRNVHPHTPRGRLSLTGHKPSFGPKALGWALAQVRNDLLSRPSISPKRRAVIMAALGPAVHRALARGHIRHPKELRRLVGFILARLDERPGLGLDHAETRRWAEWCVREGLQAVQEDREAWIQTQRMLRRMRAEAEEARRAWENPRAQARVARQMARLKRAPEPPKPLGELVPDLEERRRRYLALLGGKEGTWPSSTPSASLTSTGGPGTG